MNGCEIMKCDHSMINIDENTEYCIKCKTAFKINSQEIEYEFINQSDAYDSGNGGN
jgi:hypothetical protein